MCEKCDMKFVTLKCYDLHKPLCFSRWHCQLCSRFFNLCPKTAQQIKEEHKCHLSIRCKFCQANYASDEYHLCSIPKIKGDRHWPNLVFFQFASQNLNSANCLQCFELQTDFCTKNKLKFRDFKKVKTFGNILCPVHMCKTMTNNKPNACVLFRETSRGHFQKYTICDDTLLSDDAIKDSCEFDFNYGNATVNQQYGTDVSGRKRVRTNDFTSKRNELHQKPQKTMLEKFLLLVSQREWENTVYISHQAHLVHLPAILETFLDFGVIPDLLQKNSSLHCLTIPILKCKFLNGSAFLTGNLEDICNQFDICYEPVYFPENFNFNENYDYFAAPPSLEQYFLFTDSEIEKAKKTKFYDENIKNSIFDFNVMTIG